MFEEIDRSPDASVYSTVGNVGITSTLFDLNLTSLGTKVEALLCAFSVIKTSRPFNFIGSRTEGNRQTYSVP